LVVLGGLELSKGKRSRLSEQTIENLGIEDHVPARVLLKLSPLVDKEMSRGEFERELNKILSLNELLEYQKAILAKFNSLPPLKQSGLIDLMPLVLMFIGILVVIAAVTCLYNVCTRLSRMS
jgi:hypothetical protein